MTTRHPKKNSHIEAAKAKTGLQTDLKTKNKVKGDEVPGATVSSSASKTPDTLSSRSSSVNVKGNYDKVQEAKPPLRNYSQASMSKAPRQRKTPGINKSAELTKDLHTKLEQDDGAVIECTYLAPDARAVNDEKSQEWIHVLKLHSQLPFRLVKQILLQTGPYADHLAILIRHETPFRFLDLPLNIRTKIYNYSLTHHEPSIPIAVRSSTRTVWSPSYHGPNMLALLRTCKQLHTEAAPIIYTQAFSFPSTQVASDFLSKINRNRTLLHTLLSETYTSKSAQTMFHHLTSAHSLQKLSFAHVSNNKTPKNAVKEIWNDAGAWLATLDRNHPTKGLEILEFDEQAFHIREKDKKAGTLRVTCWGPSEQLEFVKGLRAKMVAEGKRLEEENGGCSGTSLE